jgi:DNA polymerase-4
MPAPHTILHVDMDAFYASIEQRDNPSLKGKPVIVGGASGRGVVSAASYEARRHGVHSAMPGATARRLCPHGEFLPVRMAAYRAEAAKIRAIFESFTPLVEPLSLDEAYLDSRGTEHLFGSSEDVGKAIRHRILAETGLTASVGIGPNKWIAKLCSDLRKPDGFVVAPAELAPFLAPLPVGKLWGVGEKGVAKLHAAGLRTLGDLQRLAEKAVVAILGPGGAHLRAMALGEDDRQVTPHRQAKSMGSETTFGHDIGEPWVLSAWLMEQVEEVAEGLRSRGLLAGGLEVKLRSGDFRTKSRSRKLPRHTQTTSELLDVAKELLRDLCASDLLPARLVGATATDLARPEQVQRGLFDPPPDARPAKLDNALDAIRARFGTEAVSRGTVWRRRHGDAAGPEQD